MSYEVIGCYHIKLNTSYASYQDALTASQSYSSSYAAYYSGSWYVCTGSYTSYDEANADMTAQGLDGTPMTASSNCVTIVATGSTKILFQFDCGEAYSLAVMPAADEGVKAQTWFKNYKYYGGFQYTRPTGENLTVVNFINIDDYVKGVLPYK